MLSVGLDTTHMYVVIKNIKFLMSALQLQINMSGFALKTCNISIQYATLVESFVDYWSMFKHFLRFELSLFVKPFKICQDETVEKFQHTPQSLNIFETHKKSS